MTIRQVMAEDMLSPKVGSQESTTTNATVTHLVTPPIDLSNDTLPRLIFYYHMYGSDIDLLDVRVRKVGTNTWTQIHTSKFNHRF
jgi:hypothetical protein